MRKKQTIAYTLHHALLHHERVVFWLLAVLLGALSVVYMVFVNAGVLSVVERESFEREVVRVSSDVALLEAEYLGLIENINLDLAQSLGFAEYDTVRYVRRDTTAVLSAHTP